MQVLLASILIVKIATVASITSSECHSHKITGFVDFEVQCSRTDDYEVNIICHSDDWTKFPKVRLDLPSRTEIEFQNCSFPKTMNFQEIFISMKIRTNSKITFRELRSLPNQQNLKGLAVSHLKFVSNNFTELSSDLLHDVLNVATLEMDNMNLISIPEGFFNNWSENVTKVDLHNNKLQKISKNDFAWLVNVVTLDLSDNEINEIEPGAFDTLIQLDFLQLKSNRLRTLPYGIFHHLVSLRSLELSKNVFYELSEDLFVNNKNLMEFAMRENNGTLYRLPNGLFKNLIYLEKIYMEENNLQILPSDLFANCSQLNEIFLNNNQLENLPLGLFNDTKNLNVLHIHTNQLKSLPAHIFKGLERLEILKIHNNQLTSLTSDVLEDLQSVEYFDASFNKLTEIDEKFVWYLRSTAEIDLSYNQLTLKREKGMQSQHYNHGNRNIKLKAIHLSNNSITELNVEIINLLKYCEYIDLSRNQISKIDLADFSLETIMHNKTDDDGTTSAEYSKIYLGDNPFHCDCSIADFVRYLNDSSDNKLYNIFERYERFRCATPSKFENQDVSKIPLQELDCSLKTSDKNDACTEICSCKKYPAKQVHTVDCSHRNLTQIPSVFGNMPNWSIELNMTGNKLQKAPSLKDSHFMKVTSLDLSHNNITKVSMDLFSTKLQHLRLHNNSISRLDSKIIDYLAGNNTLSSITLHDNNWVCDCETQQLLTFVQKKFTSYGFHEIRCYGTNRKLYKMTISELCKDTIAIVVIISLSIVFFCIFVASLVVIYYKYQREIKIWLYSKQLCLWFVTEDELDKDKEYDAFISFSHKDEDFVEKEIIAKLEAGPKSYKLCLHYRDWLAGEWIPVQISRSVAESRRTIVILTPNFLESVWGLMEFRAAHTQALKEGRTRLIVILCGDIGNMDDLDQEMKDYLRLNTYIKWGDPWFWDKLKYALPHAKEFSKSKLQNVDVINHSLQFPLSSDTHMPDVISIPNTTVSVSNSTNRLIPSPEDERLIVNSC